MQIVYHLGAHCTDDGAILKVLLRNRAMLLTQGTAVPEPDRYADLLRACAALLAGRPAEPGQDERLLDSLLPDEAEDSAHRLVLSFDGFLAFPRDAVAEGRLYPAAATRARALADVFPAEDIALCLAIRNPATWLPALSARRVQKGQPPVPDGLDPLPLRWSDLVARLRAAVPRAEVTVWCDEDTPLMWHRVLRAIAGHAEATELAQALALPASLMPDAGVQEMVGWFGTHRPVTDAGREAAVAGFLERFALPDKLESAADLPGWTAETVARLSAAYDEDCDRIAAMEGVRVLRP